MRIRTIKPGFFINENIAKCDPLARIAFIGLWSCADRDGRLEDRPARLKAQILPYDDVDFDAQLDQLASFNFITRYEVDGVRYIAITNWHKHQRPNIKEPDSLIPAPPGESTILHVLDNVSTEKGSQEIHSSIPVPVPVPVSGISEGKKGPSTKSPEYTPEFAKFWAIYPRKDCKLPAFEAFQRLTPADRAVATADVPKRMRANWEGREIAVIPHAGTYLKQRRFEDSLESASSAPTVAPVERKPGFLEIRKAEEAEEAKKGPVERDAIALREWAERNRGAATAENAA